MLYRSHIPAPPLAGFVENLWCLNDAPHHTRERILPSGTIELVVNLVEDEIRIYDPVHGDRCRRLSGAIVSGAYRGFFVVDTLEHASVIGVHFRPGGASPFLGVPAGALADAHVDLDALWGRRAAELRERLCAAPTSERRFAVLEEALVARLDRPPRRHGAVRGALDQLERTAVGVGDLAARADLSHRRFIEIFGAEIGMTPKRFARVRRFQRALALARRATSADWAGLAVAAGYCDQSHMIRDFVEFSGSSPADLHRHRGDRVKENHVVLGPAPEAAVARRG
ncbi:MAG TPA: helix-turn-helix domain-containing protein [Kofleriaceae bacterium]|nr:helix-turn-helix domain-containing protein [Kofleriaceae bacterium]